ncbi:MAG TPA: hypothetical protein VFO67_19765, partial [Gemmatimonadales bacterium]|nr:hypothetical protein [Gemmatimonadales bacterium]
MLLLEGPRQNIGGATLLIFSVFATAVQAQTPPGTLIRNGATVTYQAETGATFDPVSDSAFVTVGSPAGIAITLNKAVDRATGTLGDVLTYTITYQGLASESGGSPGSTATDV